MSDARVTLSAACKAAEAGEDVWVTWKGERLRLSKVPKDETDYYHDHGSLTVIYVRSGRFRVADLIVYKDSYPMVDDSPGGGHYRVQRKQIRALVVERHPRSL